MLQLRGSEFQIPCAKGIWPSLWRPHPTVIRTPCQLKTHEVTGLATVRLIAGYRRALTANGQTPPLPA